MGDRISDHEASTATPDTVVLENPFSPQTLARHRGDFARLIPTNRSAILAFHTIAQTLKLDPEWNPHARQFIHVEESQKDLSPQWKGSETESEVEETGAEVFRGYYRFHLEMMPSTARLGWVLGGGRSESDDLRSDIVLTLDRKKHHIRGRHARLRHHGESGALMLFVDPGKVVILDGKERVEGAQRAIGSMSTGLTLGDLSYRFEFTELTETTYRKQLEEMRTRMDYGNEELPLALEMTPSEEHYEYHGYYIQAPFASGASGVIAPGMERSTGLAVAVKRLRRTAQSIARIQLEVTVYKTIGDHPNLCRLMAELYSSGDASWTGMSPVNDVHLILSPLARETFIALAGSTKSYDIRLSAFHQALRGLSHLHHHGIMHRDIKPTNLMIASYHPLRAIIIDYGCATFDRTSNDHHRGTVPYLAPEVLQLKRKNGIGDPYENTIDIWGLGLSGYQLFFQTPCMWKNGVTHDDFANIVGDLRSRKGISDILEKMLAWDSSRRPSADHLLSLSIWPHEAAIQSSDPSSPDSPPQPVVKRSRQ